jgi:hypothetical protein
MNHLFEMENAGFFQMSDSFSVEMSGISSEVEHSV